jgi:protein gp37
MAKTKIEWCDVVWNPITGCTKVSEGCRNCYAKRVHDLRHKAYLAGKKMPEQYAQPFEVVQLHPERLEIPLHWKTPRRVFVNSMSDLFHSAVPQYSLLEIFAVMAITKEHTFMVLTKRPAEMAEFMADQKTPIYLENHLEKICEEHGWCPQDFDWPLPNVWLGVSVENQATANMRIPFLLETPAAKRFISCEPLLGPVHLLGSVKTKEHWFSAPMRGGMIDWVIAGGESGPEARPMHPDWARGLRDQCKTAGVPFFFKQWGEWKPIAPQYGEDDLAFLLSDTYPEMACIGKDHQVYSHDVGYREVYNCGFQPDPGADPWFMGRVGKKAAGRLLDGREWNEYPGLSTDYKNGLNGLGGMGDE